MCKKTFAIVQMVDDGREKLEKNEKKTLISRATGTKNFPVPEGFDSSDKISCTL